MLTMPQQATEPLGYSKSGRALDAVVDQRIVVFGAAGHIGPILVHRLAAANRLIAVDRFSRPDDEPLLRSFGAETVKMDVVAERFEDLLSPDCDLVFTQIAFMFGAEEDPDRAYETNCFWVGRVMEHFSSARIVHASTGSLYAEGDVPSLESDPVGATNVYARSRHGGELFATYFSRKNSTPACLLRYFHANDRRRGIVPTLARRILARERIAPTLGTHVNIIHLSDLVDYTILAHAQCAVPPPVINICYPERVRVADLIAMIGRALGVEPIYPEPEGEPPSLTGDASEMVRLFGRPQYSVEETVEEIAKKLISSADFTDCADGNLKKSV